MASNLAGNSCIGQHSVCLLRAAQLDAACQPVGGIDSGAVSLGLITLNDTLEYADDFTLEPENGCGQKLYTYEEPGDLLRHTVSGDLGYHDWEMMELLFGGGLILGATGGPYAGKVIGWNEPIKGAAAPNSVYLEVITKNVSADAGDCVAASGGHPPYSGHIYGKVRLKRGDRTYERDNAVLSFTGTATYNPNLATGPWLDWPGDATIRNAVYQTVGYSQTQYDDILALAGCGYAAALP